MRNQAEGSEPRSKFVLHKAEWRESVWPSRPRETNPICMFAVQRLSKVNANKIWETRPRESEPRLKFVWVHKAEWWESAWSSRPNEMDPICMLVSKGWAKRTPIKFEKPDWGKVNSGHKAEWWESVWSRWPREMNPICMLVSRDWVKRTPIKFEKTGWGKLNPGQHLFGSTRQRETRHIFG